MTNLTAEGLIHRFNLQPHPEGGHYAETWRTPGEGRTAVSLIHFLLQAGERSHWHKVDADEIWLWHAGAPLRLDMAPLDSSGEGTTRRLGGDLARGEVFQVVVPANCWQSASSLGDWTLVSCAVAPAFTFAGFTLAEPGWQP